MKSVRSSCLWVLGTAAVALNFNDTCYGIHEVEYAMDSESRPFKAYLMGRNPFYENYQHKVDEVVIMM